jgi:para-aminobenzoate synthetase component 1
MKPIKGTAPRGTTPEEDRIYAEELLASTKNQAELLMIVDLIRNDLGRICKTGSVQVKAIYELESYATVHHLTATIQGTRKEGISLQDILKATFPGGSITGAPKIRSMEIIDELEPTHRGVYTGAIGYFGFDGQADLNIAIRTIVTHKGNAFFHVGSGIVADSSPKAEYQESLSKGKALIQTLLDN